MHQDMTPGVMAGLSWYYLLASMLNAAAAAYISYMEIVSEGASRVGLAPRTRRLPDWLMVAFFGLYGLATLLILGREYLPEALKVAYGLCALANVMVAIAAGADAAHFAEVRDAGHGRGAEIHGPSLDDHQPAVGLGRPMNRTLWTLVWAVVAVMFQAMGLTYVAGRPVRAAAVHPRHRRLRLRADDLLRRRDDRLHRSCSPAAGSWPTGWSPGGSSTCCCSSSA